VPFGYFGFLVRKHPSLDKPEPNREK